MRFNQTRIPTRCENSRQHWCSFSRFVTDKRGTSAIEYCLLLAFLSLGVTAASDKVFRTSSHVFSEFRSEISGVGTEGTSGCDGGCPTGTIRTGGQPHHGGSGGDGTSGNGGGGTGGSEDGGGWSGDSGPNTPGTGPSGSTGSGGSGGSGVGGNPRPGPNPSGVQPG